MRTSFPFKAVWRVVKHVVPITLGLVALIVLIAWLAGTFVKKIEPAREDRAARKLAEELTDIVHEVEKQYIEEAIGTLRASSRTIVSAKILATIEEITVTAGDEVQAGDLLVRLNDDELEARLQQAKQSVVVAQATREEAELAFTRDSDLFGQNVIAKATYDKSKAALDIARAQVQRADEAVREAEFLLAYTMITAPKAGRIVDRLAEPGDTASPGIPILVLYDATSLRLEAPVMEQLAVKLRPGDKLDVYVDALERELEATIDEIVPQADAPSRSFLVKASLPRSDDLYEGMFGRLRIPAGTRRHLCLATSAIQRIGQLEFVDVVLPDGSLEKRYIKTGRLGIPGRVEVLSGLKADEQVVLHE